MRILILVALLSLVGCSREYTIDSNPTGANVFIDTNQVGITPVKHKSYCTTFGDKPVYTVGKGNSSKTGTLAYEPSWLNIGLDAVFFWPLLLVNAECPADSYFFVLEK